MGAVQSFGEPRPYRERFAPQRVSASPEVGVRILGVPGLFSPSRGSGESCVGAPWRRERNRDRTFSAYQASCKPVMGLRRNSSAGFLRRPTGRAFRGVGVGDEGILDEAAWDGSETGKGEGLGVEAGVSCPKKVR